MAVLVDPISFSRSFNQCLCDSYKHSMTSSLARVSLINDTQSSNLFESSGAPERLYTQKQTRKYGANPKWSCVQRQNNAGSPFLVNCSPFISVILEASVW